MPHYGWPVGGTHWTGGDGRSVGSSSPPGLSTAISNRAVAGKNNVAAVGQGSNGNSASMVANTGGTIQSSATGLGNDWNYFMDQLRAVSDTNNQFNLEQTRMVNDFNAAEAQKNRDWQQELSNTAHQREVQDLIKAGLNPILSAGGQGAVTPSGAVASGQKAVADNTVSNGVVSMISSFINAASAERVAQIHAASNAYAANAYAGASRYGSDLNFSAQMAYQKTIRDTSGLNNLVKIGTSILNKLL